VRQRDIYYSLLFYKQNIIKFLVKNLIFLKKLIEVKGVKTLLTNMIKYKFLTMKILYIFKEKKVGKTLKIVEIKTNSLFF